MGQTLAGFRWIQDSVPAVTKILMHEWWSGELLKKGITEQEILLNPAAMPTIRREPYNGMFADYVDYMVPEFKPYFKLNSTGHIFGYARALTDRTTHSIRKGEMARFRTPVWNPLREMILRAIREQRPITAAHRFQAHEQVLYQESKGLPGVYVNVDSDDLSWFYLGQSGDVAERSHGHKNGCLFLYRVYVTGDKKDAVNLEAALYRRLEEMKVIAFRQIPSGPVGKQGGLRLERGLNPVSVIDFLVRSFYREWCRSTLGLAVVKFQP